MSAEPDRDPRQPCPHCGAGPDSVLVLKKVTFFEVHTPDCVTLERLA